MARTFPDPLPIAVPLRTTWEEQWQLTDDVGDPVDLTGYQMRMQVRTKTAAALLLLEIDTAGADPMATIDVATGTINISVAADIVASLSPDNRKVAARFDAELYKPATGGLPEYVVPLLRGSVSLQARVTVLP